MEILRSIFSDFFGMTICKWGWCPGGYIENGKLICPSCGKVIAGEKRK